MSSRKVVFVGDMHMNPAGWSDIVDDVGAIENLVGVFQVGDFGYRFKPVYLRAVQEFSARVGTAVHFCDGNHDNHEVIAAARRENWVDPIALWPETAPDVLHVPRGGIVEVGCRRIMAVGGAVSTDMKGRGYMHEWWPGEALSMAETYRAMDAAVGGVDVMMCHDTPSGTEPGVADRRYAIAVDVEHQVRAHRDALAAIAEVARPSLIVHGHHHHRYNGRWRGARVIGLGRDGDGRRSWEAIDLDTLAPAVL